MQREDYWLSCGRYIERNPVESGLVAEPWAYPWSSARTYALGEANRLLTEDPAYTELSPDPERRRQLWQQFLLGKDSREATIAQGDWAIGTDSFRQALAMMLGRPLPRRRGRPGRPAAQTVIR